MYFFSFSNTSKPGKLVLRFKFSYFSDMHNSICIIPARGGSKRIPGKNLKFFHGRPILCYAIEAALKSGLFSEVMVSTDDRLIAETAVKYGASVPFMRDANLADDFSTTAEVLLDVLEKYRSSGREFDRLCCIYPTAAFVLPEHIRQGFEQLENGQASVVFPVLPFEYPIWRAMRKTDEHLLEMIWPENENKRSQDLEKAWHDAGQWYWLNVPDFLENKRILGGKAAGIPLSHLDAHDIDWPDDWELAELKFEIRRRKFLENG